MFPDVQRSHRLEILTSSEIEDLYGPPRFSSGDRCLYFELTPVEQKAAAASRPVIAPYFVLQLGYFKAQRQFFTLRQEAVQADLRHILTRHFPDRDSSAVRMLGKSTRLAQQRVVLRLMRYRLCDDRALRRLERKAHALTHDFCYRR